MINYSLKYKIESVQDSFKFAMLNKIATNLHKNVKVLTDYKQLS